MSYVAPHLRGDAPDKLDAPPADTTPHHSNGGHHHRRHGGRNNHYNNRRKFQNNGYRRNNFRRNNFRNNNYDQEGSEGSNYQDKHETESLGQSSQNSSQQNSVNGDSELSDVPPPQNDYPQHNNHHGNGYRKNYHNNHHDHHNGGDHHHERRRHRSPGGNKGGRFSGLKDDPTSTSYSRVDPNEEELFKNTMNTGINFDNYDKIPVKVKGENIPEALEKFEDAGLHPALMDNIRRANFVKPTPVQKYSLPLGVQGRDMMACAQTGSGKTGGFLFPIIDSLLKNNVSKMSHKREPMEYGAPPEPVSPQALILSPTRELTTQIYDEARKFLYRTRLNTQVVYGGSSFHKQANRLHRYGCNILVATPGRLTDMIKNGIISLKNVKYFVLDEADHMLDMGFEQQIREIVEGELMPPKTERQTMLFSATFPTEIQRMAEQYLGKYVFLQIGIVGSATNDITQRIVYVEEQQKPRALLMVLNKHPKGLTLVFTRTKRDCDDVGHFLVGHGIPAQAIHGNRNQQSREQALYQFKSGQVRVLVATDVAARGLDISNVQHVINFDLPDNIDSYVHRIGRTGRAGNKGLATGFYNTSNHNISRQLVTKLREAKQEVPAWLEKYADHQQRSKSKSKYNSYHRGGYRSSYNSGY